MTDIPTIKGNLVEVSSIAVRPTEEYERLKAEIDRMLMNHVAEAISSEADCEKARAREKKLDELRHQLQDSFTEAHQPFDDALATLDALEKKLESPVLQMISQLRHVTSCYHQEQDRLREELAEVELRQREVTEAKEQRRLDILTLRGELAAARQVADNAERFGELKTAQEIRNGLQRFNQLDTALGSYPNPKKDAAEIRKLVADGLLHEQQRKEQ